MSPQRNLQSPRYLTDETIEAGDRVRLGAWPGVIEFVLDTGPQPPCTDWFKTEYEHGFMLSTAETGPIFQQDADEDLIFVARAKGVAGDNSL